MSMPAEWHPQSAIYLAWPCSEKIWPNSRPHIFADFAKLVETIAPHTPVKLLCEKNHQDQALAHLSTRDNITLIDIKTDDVWIRDYGPIFTKGQSDLTQLLSWQFNAWGRKFADFANDNAVAQQIADQSYLQLIKSNFTFEGGAIDANGAGLGITTKSVIHNINRNPAEQHTEVTQAIKTHYDLDELIILEDGLINDDTDGHIDNVTRFFKERGILTCTCDANNPNNQQLQANLAQLEKFRFADGEGLEIIELPLPDPIFHEGKILPASYANFLISNSAVFIPSFDQKENNSHAQNIIQNCFPNKKIIPIDCRLFILEGGAIHCLSQQEISS